MTSSELNLARINNITQRLEKALKPLQLEVIDESHLHAGHVGAQSGKGHFAVSIRSEQFTGILPLKRHQLVYGALRDLMDTDIHALRISANT